MKKIIILSLLFAGLMGVVPVAANAQETHKCCKTDSSKTCAGKDSMKKTCAGKDSMKKMCAEKNPQCASAEIVLNNIMTRTSIRAYQDKTVEKEKVEKILRAGMAAPSAMNKQPWAFVVVTNKELLTKIGSELRNAGMTAKAPMAIVVCGDKNKMISGDGKDFWIDDCSAATENILLAAHALGLGAVWTGFYPDLERCGKLSTILGLSDNLIPLNVIPMGYPAQNPAPKDKWKPENIIVK